MFGVIQPGEPVSAEKLTTLSAEEQAEWATWNAAYTAWLSGGQVGPAPAQTPTVVRLTYLNQIWSTCQDPAQAQRCTDMKAIAAWRDAFGLDLGWSPASAFDMKHGELYESPEVAAAAGKWRLCSSPGAPVACIPTPEPAGIWRIGAGGVPVRSESSMRLPPEVTAPSAPGAAGTLPWGTLAVVGGAAVLALVLLARGRMR